MKLKYDPLPVFHTSRTPVGLYVRQKWLDESQTTEWRKDFESVTHDLYQGQATNGSWANSAILTTHRLFAFHLTVRYPDARIEKALDWLIETCLQSSDRDNSNKLLQIRANDLLNLPFVPSRSDFLLKAGCLFLASVFGYENDKRIVSVYKRLNQGLLENPGAWGGRAAFSNTLRAFVAHAKYSRSESVDLAVDRLKREQRANGSWASGVPFYLTVNALAHLDSSDAERQIQRAFGRLRSTQSPDGRWGRAQSEWHTFLVVHALRRKGLI